MDELPVVKRRCLPITDTSIVFLLRIMQVMDKEILYRVMILTRQIIYGELTNCKYRTLEMRAQRISGNKRP